MFDAFYSTSHFQRYKGADSDFPLALEKSFPFNAGLFEVDSYKY